MGGAFGRRVQLARRLGLLSSAAPALNPSRKSTSRHVGSPNAARIRPFVPAWNSSAAVTNRTPRTDRAVAVSAVFGLARPRPRSCLRVDRQASPLPATTRIPTSQRCRALATAHLRRSSPAQTPRPTSPSRWHDQRRNDGLLRRSRVADEVDRVSLAERFVMSALASPPSRSRVASASKARSRCYRPLMRVAVASFLRHGSLPASLRHDRALRDRTPRPRPGQRRGRSCWRRA
jgi:hypothetical protein